MNPRAATLVSALELRSHPEGGHYREVHRSSQSVTPADGRGARAGITVIYFLLTAGDISRWHRVASDEVWNHYEGDGLDLFVASADFSQVAHRRLGSFGDQSSPVAVVRAGEWQAARPRGSYALAGCAVGPGFEFDDFQMLRDDPALAREVRLTHPEWGDLI